MNNTAHNTYFLLENLLDWSLSKTKTLEPDLTLIHTEQAVTESIKSVEIQAKSKEININYNPKQKFEIYADRKMFSSIVRNILTNSIKFSPKNNSIDIYENFVEIGNNKFYQLSITDRGIGMDNEQIEKILNSELGNSNLGTDGEKGTGLGLQLCKNFVYLHNGFMQIDSKINQGTTISINLPA